jgi:DNA-binding NtrC family response regulator
MRRSCRVLVVEDEPAVREVLQARLEQWGFPVRTASTVQLASSLLISFDPHVVISDLVLPDATGIALLHAIRAQRKERTVLLITAYGTIDTAVQAIKAGAAEFLTKPLDYVALRRQLEAIDRKIAADAPGDDGDPATQPLDASPNEPFFGMVGASSAMHALHDEIRMAAASEASVLIVGESGTGKELVARTIHALSRRRERALVAVNAAAVPEALAEAEYFGVERGAFTGATQSRAGLFEEAHRSTLFLDEVTEIPPSLQPKFLRVLEDGQVRRLGGGADMSCDVRIVSATNRDPLKAVQEGRFREDLYYRLDVLRVDVPPLRARKEDIPALAMHFLREAAASHDVPVPDLSRDALERLTSYEWPGNVRELRNWISRAFARSGGHDIKAEHMHVGEPSSLGADEPERPGIVIPHGVTAAEAERILILETLRSTGNNKTEAARRLGFDVKTIRNKLKAFDSGGTSE